MRSSLRKGNNALWRWLFSVFAAFWMVLSLGACAAPFNGIVGADMEVAGAARRDIEGIGPAFFLTVPNSQIVVKFNDYVKVAATATWTLSTDLEGNQPIASKTVSVSVGEPISNLFYIYVSNGGDHETYPVLVHRNYMFTVAFNTLGGAAISPTEVEEGHYLDPKTIPNPSKKGYTFTGWDYDFANLPITKSIVATAIYDANAYRITYHHAGGDGPTSQTVYFDHEYKLATSTRLGYSLVGWYYDGNLFPNEGTYTLDQNVSLFAGWQIIHYSIQYYLNGGSFCGEVPETYTVEDAFYLPEPHREGYTFKGWSMASSLYGLKEEIYVEKGTTGHLVFYAAWEARQNHLDVVNMNPTRGVFTLESGTGYSDEMITVKATPNAGHEFTKIMDSEGKTLVKTTDEDVSETFTISVEKPAGWQYLYLYEWNSAGAYKYPWPGERIEPDSDGNCLITLYPKQYPSFILNNGNGTQTNDLKVSDYLSYTMLRIEGKNAVGFGQRPQKSGCEFSFFMPPYVYGVYAYFTPIEYPITFECNGGLFNDDQDVPSTYNVEQSISLPIPYLQGYEFAGWLDEENNPVMQIEVGSMGEQKFFATWSAAKNTLTVKANASSAGTATIEKGEGYTNEMITVEAHPEDGYGFYGWWANNRRVSVERRYTFKMPTYGLELAACFAKESTAEQYRYATKPVYTGIHTYSYGLYPQSVVDDPEVIAELETLEPSDLNGWVHRDGVYYTKATSFTLPSGEFDTEPRFSNGERMEYTTEYWFRCEPLEWRILVASDFYGYAIGMCEKQINAMPYSTGTSSSYDYAKSDIRKWLIGDFLNTAFALGSDKLLAQTCLNNNTESVAAYHSYECDSTYDKAFLLCGKDLINKNYGFNASPDEPDTRRACGPSDYGLACHATSGTYYTRSAFGYAPKTVYGVRKDGSLYDDIYVNRFNVGVRPAIRWDISV